MENQEQFKAQVLSNLDDSIAAFSNGDPAFFEHFAKDATIFSVDSTEPVKGREAYRQKFESALVNNKRDETVLDRTIQIVGDKAVVAQTAQIKQSDVTANVRQTIVYGQTEEGLKMLHLHTALIGPLAPNEIPTTPGAIRVLNEKIATAAAVVGVAQ